MVRFAASDLRASSCVRRSSSSHGLTLRSPRGGQEAALVEHETLTTRQADALAAALRFLCDQKCLTESLAEAQRARLSETLDVLLARLSETGRYAAAQRADLTRAAELQASVTRSFSPSLRVC